MNKRPIYSSHDWDITCYTLPFVLKLKEKRKRKKKNEKRRGVLLSHYKTREGLGGRKSQLKCVLALTGAFREAEWEARK